MRFFIAYMLVALSAVCANAQSLNLYNIDTTGYPIIRADYVAVDGNARAYTGLTSADFRVVERLTDNKLIEVSATVVQRCDTSTADSAASLIIVIDQSGSMNQLVGGVRRVDIAKKALRDLVAQLNFGSGTEVCIIGFSSLSRMVCPWTDDPLVLTNAINSMTMSGGTNYEMPFTGDPNIFDEFRKRDPAIPKMAIFITDGRPQPVIANPPVWVDSLSQMAFEQSIILHSVSVDISATYLPLEELCARTGGTSYVGSDAVLESMIKSATGAAAGRNICYLEWRSPVGCGTEDRIRTAIVTLLRDNNPVDTVVYTSSYKAAKVVTTSARLLNLGDPPPGLSSEASVALTATTYNQVVSGYLLAPTTHFKVIDWDYPLGRTNPPSPSDPLTLVKGVSTTLRVRFTQDALPSIHVAMLNLFGDDCTIEQPMLAGSNRIPLRLLTPNGGEIFSTCDSVDITWQGVAAQTPVLLQWSSDGVTWNDIATDVTGLKYKWKPSQGGTSLRVRVLYTPPGNYSWLHHIGHSGSDTVSAVAINPVNGNAFVTGWYSGSTQFGNGIVNDPVGAVDGFCLEIDKNGTPVRTFLLPGAKGKNERIVGAVVDKLGNAYIAGTLETTTTALSNGTDKLALAMTIGQPSDQRDGSNMFLVKISPQGVPLWVRYAQGLPAVPGDVTATSIGIKENAAGQPEIVVVGTFNRFISTGIAKSGQYLQLGPALPLGSYYATFEQNGAPTGLYAGLPSPGYQFPSQSATYPDGTVVEANQFVGTVTKEMFSAEAHGAATDAYVAVRKAGTPLNDSSDAPFAIRDPQLTLQPDTLAMQQTIVKSTSTNTFTQRVCNPNAYPTTISSVSIDGPNAREFTLLSSVIGVSLQPNACVDLVVRFQPAAAGTRMAALHIHGECDAVATAALVGEAVHLCSLFVMDTVRFANLKVGATASTSQCIFRNESTTNLKFKVRIEPPGSPFDMTPKGDIILVPKQCLTSTISFNASTLPAGQYSAQIVYDMPTQCGVVTTELTALVVDTVAVVHDTLVSIGNIDWYSRRVGSRHDSTVFLRNDGDVDVFIESIAPSVAGADVTLDNTTLPALPLLVKQGESVPIGVVYTPTSRGPHSIDVVAMVRGQNTPVKGLAKGRGILPAIAGTGDVWPSTPVLAVAAKTGSVVIRNTDAVAALRVSGVMFEDPSQADFYLKMPATLSFPVIVPPNGMLSIPVEFVPQRVGVRRELVRILHDAMAGPDPLPINADTSVELVGIGEAGSPLDPLEFPQTLTCDTAITSFWLKNISTTSDMVIDDISESDADDAFELLSANRITIGAADSVLLFVQFMPRSPQTCIATLHFVSTTGITQYVTCTGKGITTKLLASLVSLQHAIPGTNLTIPVSVTPSLPYFMRPLPMRIELLYEKRSLEFVDVAIEPSSTTIASIDGSVLGRIAVDVVGDVNRELILKPTFRSLLASDTIVNIAANLSAEYRCVLGDSTQVMLNFVRPCAGSSRVVNISSNGFAVTQLYPSPATDVVTIRYSVGYTSSVTLDIIDAVGNVVSTMTTADQPAALYETDVQLQGLAAGLYGLRMTSGHFSETKTFAIIR